MKRKRYSEEQIVRIPGEVRRGKSIAAVCREYGVSEQTVYRWRSEYGGGQALSHASWSGPS